MKKDQHNYLRNHIEIVTVLYGFAVFISIKVLSLPEAQKDLVTLLSSGAILATFGSAIGTIGLIWQNDLLERIKLNVDILFKDILKEENPWRRWPFLPRVAKKNLLDDTYPQTTLRNPEIPLDVGTHVIKIDLPMVLEDFFDLPLIKNWWPLTKFRKAAHTIFGRKSKDEINPDTKLNRTDEYISYECMYDIWNAIFKFRIARYIIHFGSGLTISSGVLTVIIIVLSK